MQPIRFSERWLLLPVVVASLSAILFALFYLSQPYGALLRWYFQLNDCFYLKDDFARDFFNANTKAKGNAWCVLALFTGAALLAYCGYQWCAKSKVISLQRPRIQWADVVANAVLLLVGTTLWCYANGHLKPSMDEVFSAVECAGMHPFQTMSYYMLPNNHLLFNLLNNLVAQAAHQSDLVFTGRVLSLIAFLLLLCWAYQWLFTQFHARLPAIVTTMVLAMQVPVWGFAAQARGYEWYLLASWVAFTSLYDYHLGSKSRKHLASYLTGFALGFMILPSFLYFAAGLLVFAAVLQIRHRQLDRRFWKYTAIGMGLVLFFYLPAICFSGLSAFAENRYVAAGTMSRPQFLAGLQEIFLYFLKEQFFGVLRAGFWRNYLLFLMPLALLFVPKGKYQFKGVFFILLWLTFLLIATFMKSYPFPRNLIAHFSLTLAFGSVAIFYLLQSLLSRFTHKPLGNIAYVAAAIAAFLFLGFSFREISNTALYGVDVNQSYVAQEEMVADIPAEASVACTQGNFMLIYILQQKQHPVNHCSPAAEDYLIRHQDETISPIILQAYLPFAQRGEMLIYKRKPLRRQPVFPHEAL